MLRVVPSTNVKAVAALLSSARLRDAATERRTARIVADVRAGGDRALRKYAAALDGLAGPIEIPRSDWEAAADALPARVRGAIRRAATHIRRVARAQVPRGFRLAVADGISVEQRIIPLDRVGCYVPGGRYPLPSSLADDGDPGARRRCEERGRRVASPASRDLRGGDGGRRRSRVSGRRCARDCGDGLWHADTCRAWTRSSGPGNRWVSAAKAMVTGDCAIDFYAGPTEILIVAARGPAAWIASDLIAQAEHDPDARAVLITPSRRLARQVADDVERLAPADGLARVSLQRHGAIVLTRTIGGGDGTRERGCAGASGGGLRGARPIGALRRCRLRRAVDGAGCG